MQKPIIVVEGNLGAGKSTVLRLLEHHLVVKLVYEPHRQWQNVQGENLLAHFYTNPQRWAYSFQTFAFVTRVVALEKACKEENTSPIVLERSIYSDRYCFAKNAFELGFLNDLEWKLYQEWFTWLEGTCTHRPDGFIYLRTNPHVCYDRMIKRNRSEESAVSLEYLQQLHEKHENWLIFKKDVAPVIAQIPVLVLDCDKDFEHNTGLFDCYVAQIQEFIAQHFHMQTPARSYIQPLSEKIL